MAAALDVRCVTAPMEVNDAKKRGRPTADFEAVGAAETF